MTYASPVSGYGTKTHLSKLQNFHSKILRIITKLPKATSIEIIHEQIGIGKIKNHIRKLGCKLHFKSQFSDNSQIKKLGPYAPMFVKHK